MQKGSEEYRQYWGNTEGIPVQFDSVYHKRSEWQEFVDEVISAQRQAAWTSKMARDLYMMFDSDFPIAVSPRVTKSEVARAQRRAAADAAYAVDLLNRLVFCRGSLW